MSGPVSPPLATTESGTTVRVQPTNTLEFNGADFTVTQSGSKASISIDSTGTGAALTATQIGFGDASNLLTGDSVFTYTTPGSLPTVTIGDSTLQDAGGNFKLTGKDNLQIATNSTFGSIKFYPATGSTNALEIAYTGKITLNPDGNVNGDVFIEGDTLTDLFHSDASQDNIGIGGSPDSDALLHIKGDGSKNYTVNIESTDTDAAVGPVIRLIRDPGETVQVNDDLGQLVWWGPGGDGSGTPRVYSKILTEVQGASSGSEHSRVMFKGIISGTEKEFIRYSATGIELNAFEQDIDTKISSDGVDGLFTLDASQDNIGIGGTPDSDVQRLQVKGDSTNTSTTDPVVRIENERSGAIFTALELVNESNDANSDVLFRMTSKAGTDSDFEILHNSFGTTTFTSNQPNSGTVEAFRISDDDMFVNNDQVDFNFTVKSDNNANMLKVDGGLDRVGIGASPTSGGATLQVPDNTISHYCNVNAVRSDAVSTMVMVNEDNQGQMWVHDSVSAHTLQLVEGGVKGMHFQFMSTDGNITIDPQGSDTLNGGTASLTRSTNFEIYDVFCYDAGKWALSNPA